MRTHIKHFINWQAQGCVAKGFRVRHTAHIYNKGVSRQLTGNLFTVPAHIAA